MHAADDVDDNTVSTLVASVMEDGTDVDTSVAVARSFSSSL